ncbi:uncharacterized protein BDV17DRAFT_137143 [Aspergillus undulatus]|uniref:uncharacterized protein n=1 Tax=Aspergillus undulatus TaxID=1810928 RepID=UPI003CCCF39A
MDVHLARSRVSCSRLGSSPLFVSIPALPALVSTILYECCLSRQLVVRGRYRIYHSLLSIWWAVVGSHSVQSKSISLSRVEEYIYPWIERLSLLSTWSQSRKSFTKNDHHNLLPRLKSPQLFVIDHSIAKILVGGISSMLSHLTLEYRVLMRPILPCFIGL